MEEIINKYKDVNGFVIDILKLYQDISNNFSKKDAIVVIKEVLENNKRINKLIEKVNEEIKSIIIPIKHIVEIEYKKQEKVYVKKVQQKTLKKDIDIKSYISYLDEKYNDINYIKTIPKNILIKIISYYKSLIVLNESILILETDEKEIEYIENELLKLKNIINVLLEQKATFNNIIEVEQDIVKNKISYFMNGDMPYIISDIIGAPENYVSVKKLVSSIENGTFKNIRSFVGMLKGLFEVRDISQQTRVVFEINENGEYCIIAAITNKSETNRIYQTRLINRYKLYKENKDNIMRYEESNVLKKLLKGDYNG